MANFVSSFFSSVPLPFRAICCDRVCQRLWQLPLCRCFSAAVRVVLQSESSSLERSQRTHFNQLPPCSPSTTQSMPPPTPTTYRAVDVIVVTKEGTSSLHGFGQKESGEGGATKLSTPAPDGGVQAMDADGDEDEGDVTSEEDDSSDDDDSDDGDAVEIDSAATELQKGGGVSAAGQGKKDGSEKDRVRKGGGAVVERSGSRKRGGGATKSDQRLFDWQVRIETWWGWTLNTRLCASCYSACSLSAGDVNRSNAGSYHLEFVVFTCVMLRSPPCPHSRRRHRTVRRPHISLFRHQRTSKYHLP